ncbi:MAG: APC family permease [Gammaproteobacteria bacterium]
MAEKGSGLRRDAGVIGLLYFSLGAIIGSGWLFGPFDAAKIAGPWSVASWVIGAVIVLLIAFVYAELATMMPKSGALIHISHIGHGVLIGRIWSWILYLASVVSPPIEVMAVLTYLNNKVPYFVQPHTHVLTGIGFGVAIVLLAVAVVLNFFAIRLVLWINSAVTWWKVFIPAISIAILMSYSFHPGNFHLHLGSVHAAGMLTAVSTAGIIFSFLGFRLAINLGGETKNPGKYIPIAVIGSILIATFIYVGLEIATITAIRPQDFAGGWDTLAFKGDAGPFAALAVTVGALWWSYVLYADAIISPFGTGLIYTTNTSRLGYGMAEVGSAPSGMHKLNRHGVPWVSLVVTFVIACVFFFPFPSWHQLVGYVSDITVLSYGIGPIVLLIMRRRRPEEPRSFRLRGAWIVAPLAFIASNLVIFWTGATTVTFLFGLLGALFILYALWFHVIARKPTREFGWRNAWWVFPYFIGMWVLSWIGPGTLGPEEVSLFNVHALDFLSLGWDMIAIAVFSLAILYCAVTSALPREEADVYYERIKGADIPGEIAEA